MEGSEILSFERVDKSYPTAAGEGRLVLSRVSFRLGTGDKIALVGRSGSGKSTLLNLAAGIDVPSSGQVSLLGRDLDSLPDRERTLLRRNQVGLIFQFFYLLPHLTLRQNVGLPEMIAGTPRDLYADRVEELLDRVGLASRADDRVEKLSGGEMQRVAICRALVRQPKLVLADEPTGNLDDETAGSVMQLIFEMVERENSALILATHSEELARKADATWRIHSGQLEWE